MIKCRQVGDEPTGWKTTATAYEGMKPDKTAKQRRLRGGFLLSSAILTERINADQ